MKYITNIDQVKEVLKQKFPGVRTRQWDEEINKLQLKSKNSFVYIFLQDRSFYVRGEFRIMFCLNNMKWNSKMTYETSSAFFNNQQEHLIYFNLYKICGFE